MIDKETEIFNAVANGLRAKFSGIYIVGTELSTAPPKFPAVSFTQTNNTIMSAYSTFHSLENVVKEEYKAEVYSNLEKGKEKQTKEITTVISDILRDLGYDPYVMVYDKPNASKEIKNLQRWVNNRFIFRSCEKFEDYKKGNKK